MITHADSVLIAFYSVLDPDAQFQLKSAIENLNASISNFRSIGETINNSLSENGQLHQTFDNLADLSADLSVVTSSMKEAKLDNTFEVLGSAVGNLSQILDRIEEGEAHWVNSSPKMIFICRLSKPMRKSNSFLKICG